MSERRIPHTSRPSARKDLLKAVNSHACICETLRMVYDEIEYMADVALREKITELLVDAVIMAKKMADRLVYYQRTYGDDTGNKASSLVLLPNTRAKLARRKVRSL